MIGVDCEVFFDGVGGEICCCLFVEYEQWIEGVVEIYCDGQQELVVLGIEFGFVELFGDGWYEWEWDWQGLQIVFLFGCQLCDDFDDCGVVFVELCGKFCQYVWGVVQILVEEFVEEQFDCCGCDERCL